MNASHFDNSWLHAGQVQDVASVETTNQAELGEDTDRLQRQRNLEPSTSGSTFMQPSILCARCYSLRHYGYVVKRHGIALASKMQEPVRSCNVTCSGFEELKPAAFAYTHLYSQAAT